MESCTWWDFLWLYNLVLELNVLQQMLHFYSYQIKKILDNIPIIQATVPHEFHPLVDAFSALKELRMATYGQRLNYCSPRPAPYYRNVVKNVERKWDDVHEKFGTSLTPKIHVIMDHIPDYIEEKGLHII